MRLNAAAQKEDYLMQLLDVFRRFAKLAGSADARLNRRSSVLRRLL